MEKFKEGLKAVFKWFVETLQWVLIFTVVALITAFSISFAVDLEFALSLAIVLIWYILVVSTCVAVKVLP